MQVDLVIAVSVVLLVSMICAWVAARLTRHHSSRLGSLLAAGAVAVLLLYAFWLADNLLLARLMPVADVIAWSNVQTPATALLAGVSWARINGPRWQRHLLVGVLACAGVWRLASPYIGTKPPVGTARWDHGVCRQSSTSSCSAASAATLLAAHGIATTESEMIDRCLTHVEGTTLLGVYRGLKLKTAGTSWDVAVIDGSAAGLPRGPLPAMITISAAGVPTGLLGIGNRHSVVVFGFPDSQHVDIGDPFAGRQTWTIKQLEQIDQGNALALVPRTKE